MAPTKRAVLFATSIAVTCPHCSAEYPSPDSGSDMWLPEQVRAAHGQERTCVSCDEVFVVSAENKIGVSR